ncbi:MAG TPA: Fe(2+)-trafficking protein [Chloroflexota bacterium]|nr:Fe(2+)-trafficking protein [Chloroflexota bacterium]
MSESQVTCRRCGQTKAGLEKAPLPGKWGALVLTQTCAECWHEWFEEQTRLINHEGLLPAQAEHRKVLYERMGTFLHLAD